MWRVLVLMAVAVTLGCANEQRPRQASPQPTTGVPRDDSHLIALRERRAELAAEVRELEAALTKLQDENRDLDEMREILKGNTANLSQALTDAKIDTIDAKSKYAGGHPAVQSAVKREEELYGLYQQSMKRMNDVNKLALERDRLAERLRELRESLRRLDDRIAHLEDRRA